MSAKPDALLTLIAGGQSHARIVVAVDAPPVEAHAAEELQRYLRAMSGSEVTLIHEAHPRLANLLIGAAAVARYPDLKDLVLGIDGYVV